MKGVDVVAPLVEALLLRALQRRPGGAPTARVSRLVGEPRPVDSLGVVAEGTSVLLRRPGADVEVLPAGSLVLPTVLGTPATYVVVTHVPVDVWLRVGPFDTLEGRVVERVELRLTVVLGDSPSGLGELTDPGRAGANDLAEVGTALLDRLAREVSSKTTEAVRRRTLAELTDLSVGVLLDQSLPTTFVGGLVTRSALEVTDVDWPTEGRGRPAVVVPGSVPR